MFVATLNKTLKSYIFAIVGAEYILRWLPIGTHEWEKFLKPGELISTLKNYNLSLDEIDGMQFSWFSAMEKPLNSRKQWISGALQVKGKITIDKGAAEAMKKGFSMLSAGIISTEGNYEKGDLIQIVDEQQNFVGKGLIHFNNSEVDLIKGSKSNDIESILGYRGKDEVVHRDDLVLEKK